mgnify:CR=1 FL=1
MSKDRSVGNTSTVRGKDTGRKTCTQIADTSHFYPNACWLFSSPFPPSGPFSTPLPSIPPLDGGDAALLLGRDDVLLHRQHVAMILAGCGRCGGTIAKGHSQTRPRFRSPRSGIYCVESAMLLQSLDPRSQFETDISAVALPAPTPRNIALRSSAWRGSAHDFLLPPSM